MTLLLRSALTIAISVALPSFALAACADHHPAKGNIAHSSDQGISVVNAKVRQPIPGRNMSAAFMQISNHTQQDVELVSARADWSERIELHTHLHENGVMMMREIDSLPIAAGSSVALQPGGLHLMLFGLSPNLSTHLPLELCFSDQHCITVEAELFDPR